MKQNNIHEILLNNDFFIDKTTNVWRPVELPAFAYNDGDEAENYVLKSVTESADVSINSKELSDKMKDWPSTYHLSSRRSNLLRPFEQWLKGKKVLEIGCGCGAITRFLGESGADVVSVEGSLRRAQIARARTRDLSNVDVICAPSDIIPDIGHFDAVILVGVLEYARVFLGRDGQKTLLDSCRDRMTETGKLFVAIENKLGIKYFSGVNEDHVNMPMFGINNSYTEKSVVTFGRSELKAVLANSGFLHNEEFLPLPDYKLPVSIICPRGWKNFSSQFSQLAIESAHQDPQKNSENYFSIEEGLYNIWNNDLAPDLSNSFLMVSSQIKPDEEIIDQTIAAYHFSDGRANEFKKTTLFKTNLNDELVVLTSGGDASIPSSVNEHSIVESGVFHDGESLWLSLVHTVNKPNWTIQDIVCWSSIWINEIQKRASLSKEFNSLTVLPSEFLDAMPFNFITLDNGDKKLFDQEWNSPAEITLGYIVFRGIFHSLLRLTSISSSPSYRGESIADYSLSIMNAIGFSCDDDFKNTWLKAEADFLASVQSKDAVAILSVLKEVKLNVRRDSAKAIVNDLNNAIEEQKHLQEHIAELLTVADERASVIQSLELDIFGKEMTIKTLEDTNRENFDKLNNSHLELLDKISLRDQQLAELYNDAALNEQLLGQYRHENHLLQQQLNGIYDSTSWKFSAPVRVISRRTPSYLRNPARVIFRKFFYIGQSVKVKSGKVVRNVIRPAKLLTTRLNQRSRTYAQRVYHALPDRYKLSALKVAMKIKPEWFYDHPSFIRTNESIAGIRQAKTDWMVDINTCRDNFKGTPGKVAVHCHIFYHDLINEFSAHLSVIPFSFDVYVSVTTEEGRDVCTNALKKIKNIANLYVEIVPNRGRDIAPMFCQFGERLKEYDYVCHIQSKKSLYNGGTTLGWREYLFNTLLGTEKNTNRIFGLFQDNPTVGIIFPQAFVQVPYPAFTWLANKQDGAMLCQRIGIPMPESYYHFPAGSMFWAKMSAMKPLFDLNLQWEEFPEELGQTDGTLAHALERMLGIVPTSQGYQSIIIKDHSSPSWSPFRFDQQYLNRADETYSHLIRDSKTKVIAFDIFDTLLVRPLLVADHTKEIIRQRLNESEGKLFANFRAMAEVNARNIKGKDISISDIYEQFGLLTKLSVEKCAEIQRIEESVELASVSPRKDMVHLLNKSKEWGKRVVLISDMFLSIQTIETMLELNGIDNYDRLYLSSDLGIRKDTGQLYSFMLDEEGVKGEEVVMFGDNERSDLQLPCDEFKLRALHILRAADLAKSLPEYETLIRPEVYENNLNRELTIGMLVRENLNKCYNFDANDIAIFSSAPRQLGFNLVGPTISAFCAWLAERAKAQNVTDLYFLAREGKLIKQVYDAWSNTVDDAPNSHYLQVSRRAVNVPNIASFEDICAIAMSNYYPNKVQSFFYERFGLELSDDRWNEIYASGVWKKGTLLQVKDGDLSAINDLLHILTPDILAESSAEKNILLQYFDSVGLTSSENVAVVDVGYSGTIQKSINKLLSGPIHGFYFATAHNIREGMPENAFAEGCYVELGQAKNIGSRIFSNSFCLEQLLSANDPQVTKYVFDEDNLFKPRFKVLSEAELSTQPTRNALQEGAMDFVNQSVEIRNKFYNSFVPSVEIADVLYADFIEATLENKNNVLEKMVLDDDYCGRGLIN